MSREGKLGLVRKDARRGTFYIDFRSRNVKPRRLYSYQGHTIESSAEGEAYLTLIRAQVVRGRPLQDVIDEVGPQGGEGPGIDALMDEWGEQFRRKADLGDRSWNSYREIKRWIEVGPHGYLAWWRGASLFTIDEGSLDEWSLWMAEKRLSAKTRRNVMAALHSFCVWARRRRKTWEIPEFPWPEPDEHVPNVITPELQEKVLSAIPEEKRGAFLAMARLLIRPNEARVARVSDWQGDTLLIHRGQKDRHVGGREGGTKKHRGTKRLPIPEELMEWLEQHVPRERRLDKDALLFTNPDARNARGQWSEAAMRRVWYRACTKAGVQISLYEGTKHSTATALKAASVEDRVLAQVAGHSDVRSIARYAKLETEVIRAAIARLPGR